MTNLCGSCSACCRVFAVPEVKTKHFDWCDHCEIGKGCKIYDTRPETCVKYECMWLECKKAGMTIPDNLRPDKSKCVISMTTSPHVVNIVTLPGYDNAWKAPGIVAFIKRVVADRKAVVIGPPGSTTRTFINEFGVKTVQMTEPDHEGMQYNVEPEIIRT